MITGGWRASTRAASRATRRSPSMRAGRPPRAREQQRSRSLDAEKQARSESLEISGIASVSTRCRWGAGGLGRRDLGTSPNARPFAWAPRWSSLRNPPPLSQRGPRHEQLRDGAAGAPAVRSGLARGPPRSPGPPGPEPHATEPAERCQVAGGARRGSCVAVWRRRAGGDLATDGPTAGRRRFAHRQPSDRPAPSLGCVRRSQPTR